MILVGKQGIRGDLPEEIARLEDLTAHLEKLASGQMPSERELLIAPLLERFVLTSRPRPCLSGQQTGHPLLKGSLIRTSEIWVIAPTWMRTYSRLYRLGEPLFSEFLHAFE